MYPDRMIELAQFLDDLEPRKFNMVYWYSYDNGGWYSEIPTQLIDGNECGTAACIAGWAVLFSNNMILDRNYENTVVLESNDDGVRLPIMKEAAEYFGLSIGEAMRLFTNTTLSPWNKYQNDFGFDEEDLEYVQTGGDPMEVISNSQAANMLRKVANGEWSLL